MEEEDLPEAEEAEMEEEEAIQDPQEVHLPEETQSPLDLTYHSIYDPSLVPMIRNQWGTSPTSLTETEPKQKHSSTNSTIISYSILTSPGSTLLSKRLPLPSHLSKALRSPDGLGH